MRGPYIITESCTFDLTTLGLKIGDIINVICIGGGGGTDYDMWSQGFGGGACGKIHSSGARYCGPGAGSGYVAKGTFQITGSTSVTVTIGSAGTSTATTSVVGGTGGTTSFGSYLSAAGGAGAKGSGSSDSENSSPGIGGNNGSYGGSSYVNAAGGLGFVNDGIFSVKTADGSGIQTNGKGVVFLWW